MSTEDIKTLIDQLRRQDKDALAMIAPRYRKHHNPIKAQAADALTTLLSQLETLTLDAERYRWAIAKEDNAELLYAAVLRCGPAMPEGINAEVDAARPQIDGSN